ncbi:hypothetical protein ABIE26_002994 [Pedobacter africanus]|uniref:hypothetical protein n=1 Tax=Pedobacter africanus TaxID=151894 RepID=UPI00339A0BB7
MNATKNNGKAPIESQENNARLPLYRVYDEMACEDLLFTNDLQEAKAKAYNHQCILIDNHANNVIKDYSC